MRDNMKVIVTGGCGYVGSHLIEDLFNRDYTIINIDNGTPKNIKKYLSNERFHYLNENISELNESYKVFKDCDAIFHLASNADPECSINGSETDINNNFMLTIKMLEIARVNKIKDFIFASSSAVYGNSNHLLSENMGPLIPASHYGAGKLASEAFICSYAENYGIRAHILRFSNICGGRMTHGVIHKFIKSLKEKNHKLEIYGDGKQCKPYIHVSELIQAIIYIWMNTANKVNIYNIAPDTQTTLNDIAKWAMQEFGDTEIKYVPTYIGDILKYQFNTEKLKKLGFEVKMTSDEAVKKAIKELL